MDDSGPGCPPFDIAAKVLNSLYSAANKSISSLLSLSINNSSSFKKPSPNGSSEVISLSLRISLLRAGIPPIPVLS